MAYRHGFKSEANAIAREVRAELGLTSLSRLDPLALSAHLEIPILPLSSFAADAPLAVEHFTQIETGSFSACTVFDGARRAIVHNDAHSPGRQASDLAHELAHALLLHEPTAAIGDRGCRLWNQNIEDEAQWLAGALLVTEDAALWIARGGATVSDAARMLGVSEPMINYRLNVTGARKRIARGRHLRVVPKPDT